MSDDYEDEWRPTAVNERPEPPPTPQQLLTSAYLFEASLAVAAVLIGWLIGFWPLKTVELSPTALADNFIAAGVGVLAAGPLFAAAWGLWNLPIRRMRRLARKVRRLLRPTFHEATVLELALVSLIAGIGEETLFRGLFQDALATWIGGDAGMAIGLALSAVAFGVVHFVTREYAIMAGLAGLYLGGLFVLTDNLLAPIVAHAVYDFVAFWYLMRN